MKTVQLRSVELGSGRPKVCVPLVSSTIERLSVEAQAVDPAHVDLVELRVDLLTGSADRPDLVASALEALRQVLPEGMPILATYRTTREGGNQPTTDDQYRALAEASIGHGADAIDVEMMTSRGVVDRLVAAARSAGVAVILSNHDFDGTPPKEEIITRLRRQQDLGADVVKIAVMPQTAHDVITLLAASEEFTRLYATRPVITMSMGEIGAISRVAASVTGSCLSFGIGGQASAPGQLPAADLDAVLSILGRPRR